MNFHLDEEQLELRDAVRRFYAARFALERVKLDRGATATSSVASSSAWSASTSRLSSPGHQPRRSDRTEPWEE